MESDNFRILEEKLKLLSGRMVELSGQDKPRKRKVKDKAPVRASEPKGSLPASTVGRIRGRVQDMLHVLADI